MARDNKKDKKKMSVNEKQAKQIRSVMDNLIGQLNMNLYGTDRTSDVGALDTAFTDILNNELSSLNNLEKNDVTSFLGKISSQDDKNASIADMLDNQFGAYGSTNTNSMTGFIQEAYKNRKLQQADLHQVASQLIELTEAILITRDAMISPDATKGRLNRTLDIENVDDNEKDSVVPIIESVEEKFRLQNKIKDFIIPKALEYGEYYAYVVPYSKIFADFKRQEAMGNQRYTESTLLEYVIEEAELKEEQTRTRSAVHGGNRKEPSKPKNTFFTDLYKTYTESVNNTPQNQIPSEAEFKEDVSHMMANITICNDPVPIPYIEAGVASIDEFRDEFVNESGDMLVTEKNGSSRGNQTTFDEVMKGVDGVGVHFDSEKKSKKTENFDDIKDCYLKMIDPTVLIPIEIMDQTLGYYYVTAENIVPIGGKVSSNIYMNAFEPGRSERTIIDAIAEKIVKSFDKKFLKNNLQFKETIVEAITYYNINEKKLKFQYIPAEYIVAFKVDQDEKGHGQSMIKKSLFYAKLYLMLLLFKIMSIITNSNDIRVNYIKQSGIDKNIANKIQDIARLKQSRQINMMDLFNYTTLINKVGNGNEWYIPMGKSNERGMETEILSGQEVQLNTELMEMLKNAYILGTGVPAAIVNYLSEADFAKVVEQNNTKFQGRVINYQLDINDGCTELYRKILRYSTSIDENIIDNLKFILPPPKTVNNQVNSQAMSDFQGISDFFTNLYFPNDQATDPANANIIWHFKKLLAEEFVPGVDFRRIEEILKEAKIKDVGEKARPNPANGDDDNEDMGLDDLDI